MNQRTAIVAATLFGVGCCQLAAAQEAPAQSAPAQAAPAEPAPAQTAPVPETPAQAAPVPDVSVQGNVIYIGQNAPYSDVKMIDQAILNECQLPRQQAELLEQAARRAGINVVRDDIAAKAGKGRVLQVEITNAMSSGNAFIGHRKQILVKGRLLEDGKEIGNFTGRRNSMGGAFGGFKGSCSVLGRCLDALAKDITLWLRNPTMDARIGD